MVIILFYQDVVCGSIIWYAVDITFLCGCYRCCNELFLPPKKKEKNNIGVLWSKALTSPSVAALPIISFITGHQNIIPPPLFGGIKGNCPPSVR